MSYTNVNIKSESKFELELRALINRNNKENDNNTPDFILARFMLNCLNSYSYAVKQRDNWYEYGGKQSILDSEKKTKWNIT